MLILVEFFYDFVVSTLVAIFGLHLIFKKGLLASKFLGLFFINFFSRIVLAYFATDGRIDIQSKSDLERAIVNKKVWQQKFDKKYFLIAQNSPKTQIFDKI